MYSLLLLFFLLFFFFNDTATTEIYTLSLHDALPIWEERRHARARAGTGLGDHRLRRSTGRGVRRLRRRRAARPRGLPEWSRDQAVPQRARATGVAGAAHRRGGETPCDRSAAPDRVCRVARSRSGGARGGRLLVRGRRDPGARDGGRQAAGGGVGPVAGGSGDASAARGGAARGHRSRAPLTTGILRGAVKRGRI